MPILRDQNRTTPHQLFNLLRTHTQADPKGQNGVVWDLGAPTDFSNLDGRVIKAQVREVEGAQVVELNLEISRLPIYICGSWGEVLEELRKTLGPMEDSFGTVLGAVKTAQAIDRRGGTL